MRRTKKTKPDAKRRSLPTMAVEEMLSFLPTTEKRKLYDAAINRRAHVEKERIMAEDARLRARKALVPYRPHLEACEPRKGTWTCVAGCMGGARP